MEGNIEKSIDDINYIDDINFNIRHTDHFSQLYMDMYSNENNAERIDLFYFFLS